MSPACRLSALQDTLEQFVMGLLAAHHCIMLASDEIVVPDVTALLAHNRCRRSLVPEIMKDGVKGH
jgi:hypothetical protein